MPRRVYNSRQKSLLEVARERQLERVNARQKIAIRQAHEMELELAGLDMEVSKAIREALANGVAASDIQRAIGVGNWGTYTRLRDLAPESEVVVPKADLGYTITEDTFIVHHAMMGDKDVRIEGRWNIVDGELIWDVTEDNRALFEALGKADTTGGVEFGKLWQSWVETVKEEK